MRWWYEYGPFAPGKLCLAYPEPGEVIAFYRVKCCLSRAQLSRSLKVSENMLCRIERYSYCLNGVSLLCRLQHTLDIPPALLGLSDPCLVNISGSIIKQHRTLKSWTQLDLAEALGLRGDTIVKHMENKSLSLNSLSRRRALHILLGIPPALLGLDASHLPSGIAASISQNTPHPSIHLTEVQATQAKLWTGYYAGHAQDGIKQVRQLITQIDEALPIVSSSERSAWLEAQSLSYQWLVNVLREFSPASSVLPLSAKAVTLAREVGHPDLVSVALLREMETAYLLHQEEKAVELARMYAQNSIDVEMDKKPRQMNLLTIQSRKGAISLFSKHSGAYFGSDRRLRRA